MTAHQAHYYEYHSLVHNSRGRNKTTHVHEYMKLYVFIHRMQFVTEQKNQVVSGMETVLIMEINHQPQWACMDDEPPSSLTLF